MVVHISLIGLCCWVCVTLQKTRYCCLGVMRETCTYEKMICNLLALIVGSGWMSGVCNCSISASDLLLIPSDGREFSSPLSKKLHLIALIILALVSAIIHAGR